MVSSFGYPDPNYVPNKAAAGCVAAIVSISLTAWFIQSCQSRFRPRRISFLLLISHLAIFIEFIVRAAVNINEKNSKNIFIAFNSLITIGQRMIIVGNFSFVLEVHHENSRLSRGIFIGTILGIITSALLVVPATMFSFDPDQINTSFLFRELSASVLLAITLLFYPVWYWSKTVKDMTNEAIILIIVSSVLCLDLAIFTLFQSISNYYDEINNHEGWFYGFQMAPIIFAHFTWSCLHPKRSLTPSHSQRLGMHDNILLIQERSVEKL